MGLGGINTESIYADIPFEELSSKLDILKQRYIDGNIPGLAERKERLNIGGATIQNQISSSIRDNIDFPDYIKRILDMYKVYK